MQVSRGKMIIQISFYQKKCHLKHNSTIYISRKLCQKISLYIFSLSVTLYTFFYNNMVQCIKIILFFNLGKQNIKILK